LQIPPLHRETKTTKAYPRPEVTYTPASSWLQWYSKAGSKTDSSVENVEKETVRNCVREDDDP